MEASNKLNDSNDDDQVDEDNSQPVVDEQSHVSTSRNTSQRSASSENDRKTPRTTINSTLLTSPVFKKDAITSTSTPIADRKAIRRDPRRKDSSDSESVSYDEQSDTTESEETEEEEEEESDSERLSKEDDNYESESDDPNVKELQQEEHLPGTKFRVIKSFKATQSGDLTVYKNDILILVEQRSENWWLFQNSSTQEQGLVPINHIELIPQDNARRILPRLEAEMSPSVIVDALKYKGYIPSGFIASDLASLSKQDEYKLSDTLIPTRSKSNFDFSDIAWDYDKDQIRLQHVQYQQIFNMIKCSRIPSIETNDEASDNQFFYFSKIVFHI